MLEAPLLQKLKQFKFSSFNKAEKALIKKFILGMIATVSVEAASLWRCSLLCSPNRVPGWRPHSAFNYQTLRLPLQKRAKFILSTLIYLMYRFQQSTLTCFIVPLNYVYLVQLCKEKWGFSKILYLKSISSTHIPYIL